MQRIGSCLLHVDITWYEWKKDADNGPQAEPEEDKPQIWDTIEPLKPVSGKDVINHDIW